ncbi:unnamed protein product, partial [marine sediment metagenome]
WRLFDIIGAHRLELDFDLYAAGDWTITTTEGGSGAATEALADMVNGVLVVTNDDANLDMDQLVYGNLTWLLTADYPIYAEIRCKINDPDAASFWFGLVTGNVWFTEPDDYIVFHIEAADDDILFETAKDGASTSVDTGEDLGDITWVRLGFHYDGVDTVHWFVLRDEDEYCLATGSWTTNIPDDEEMHIGFGIRNDEAAAKILWVDYIKVAQKRVIE